MSKQSYVFNSLPGQPGAPLVIVAHGTGGDENQLLSLGRDLVPDAAIVSPRGDVSEHGANRFFRRAAEGVYDMADLARGAAKIFVTMISFSDDLVAFIASCSSVSATRSLASIGGAGFACGGSGAVGAEGFGESVPAHPVATQRTTIPESGARSIDSPPRKNGQDRGPAARFAARRQVSWTNCSISATSVSGASSWQK